MKLYIAVTDGRARETRFEPAWISYRVRGSRLYRARGAGGVRGGVMVVGISGYTGGGVLSALIEDIAAEISRCGFSGVVLDAGNGDTRRSASLANALSAALAPMPVFVPLSLGDGAPRTFVLLQTALSGGSLARHLTDAAARFGVSRLALECDRLRMDFRLPCPGGAGEEIDAARLDALLAASPAPRVFFSEALCVNYFFRREGENRYMTLFDDAESLRRKLRLAESLGVARAFLYYPHVSDILHRL